MKWYRHEGGARLMEGALPYDGDSFWLTVSLAFHIKVDIPIRLYGIDAPEMNSEDPDVVVRAKLARGRVRDLVRPGVVLGLETYPLPGDKYRRWLAKVYLPDGRCLNDLLVKEGLAVPYDGGAKL